MNKDDPPEVFPIEVFEDSEFGVVRNFMQEDGSVEKVIRAEVEIATPVFAFFPPLPIDYKSDKIDRACYVIESTGFEYAKVTITMNKTPYTVKFIQEDFDYHGLRHGVRGLIPTRQ